jgi:hypothetical protein
MKQFVRSVLVGWIVISLAGGAAAQTVGFSPADSKELASYRLTMETVKKSDAMMRALIEEMKKDPKFQALQKIEAEIEALESKEERTEAEYERLEKLREKKAEQEEALDDNRIGFNLNEAKTLDEMEAGLKKSPEMMAALAKVGLAPREWSKFMLMSLMAGMAAMFQKSGMIKELPKELKEIHPDNIKFILEHEAELTAMQKELEKLGKGK